MRLTIEQKQKLNIVVTSELRQAIELLQYSTYQLYQYIKDQELENPFIELIENEDIFSHNDQVYHSPSPSKSTEFTMDYLEQKEDNLRSDLFLQVSVLFKDQEIQNLLKYLILNLDDDGYFRMNESDFPTYFAYDMPTIEKGIHLLQQIGPTGIGARNLRECLLLQIAYDHPKEQLAYLLVQDHLELFATNEKDIIACKMNIPIEEVNKIHHFLKTLHPKPCANLSHITTEYLHPDIVVNNSDEGMSYYINDGYLPHIHFRKEYTSLANIDKDTSEYVMKQYNNYQWLVRSIEQRRRTLRKVLEAIMKKQEAFFKHGFTFLRPMTLKDIAEEIEMHESTVSRAIKNKVIQTKKGTFQLRQLFTRKIAKTDGEGISQLNVKVLLESLIADENKQKPFSDQSIANYFYSKKGIKISRRTISKYREELNIPSSKIRRIK